MPSSRQPLACILSTGRAGSRYISEVLAKAGIPCGHEHYYSPLRQHRSPYLVESSWLALPRVESGHFQGTCFHQVRHPLATISSFMNGQMQSNAAKPYAAFQKINVSADIEWPEVGTFDEWLRFTVEYVEDWNRRCGEQAKVRGGFTYRVEDIGEEVVKEIGEAAGVQVSGRQVQDALRAVSTSTNGHLKGPDLTWGNLPDIEAAVRLRQEAERWGYR